MSTYEFEFDPEIQELKEPGWYHERLFRDINAEVKDLSDELSLEPVTGTLMLKPVQMLPDFDITTDYEWLKVALDQLEKVGALWEEIPQGPARLLLGAGNNFYHSNQGFGVIELLKLVAVESILLTDGMSVDPVLRTNDEWPANAGIFFKYMSYGEAGIAQKHYLGIRFGDDFYLSLHLSGMADLYWHDGVSWVLRQKISLVGAPGKKEGSQFHGFAGGAPSLAAVTIIPFGRGNILIKLHGGTGGAHVAQVYHHPEASYDQGTETWAITDAAKVSIYTNTVHQKTLAMQLSKMGYQIAGEYAAFTDALLPIHYAPTVQPTLTLWHSRVGASPAPTYEIQDEAGDPFVADGLLSKVKLQIRLQPSEDKLFSPCVDGYALGFARVLDTPSRTPQTVTGAYIEKLSISDGPKWDDEKVSVTFKTRRTDSTIDFLESRSEISAYLKIDDEVYMPIRFSRPKVRVGKRLKWIELTGQNLGAAMIKEKVFIKPPTYGGQTHPEAIQAVMEDCGFSNFVFGTDTIELPESESKGADGAAGSTELKSQPQAGESVAEFVKYIAEEFAGWPVPKLEADGSWYYDAAEDPAVASATFHKTTIAGEPWADEVNYEIVPPEANIVVIVGMEDGENGTAIVDILPEGGLPTEGDFLKRYKPVIIFDPALNNDTAVKQVTDMMYARLSARIVNFTWKGPFVKTLHEGDGITLEGLTIYDEDGEILASDPLVKITSMQSEAISPRRLELTASTTYEGVLVIV